MSGRFNLLMHNMPQIMTAFAIIFYAATVFVTIVTTNSLQQDFGDTVPQTLRVKAFLLTFVQPMTSAMIILFGAALLWRVDQWLAAASGAPQGTGIDA